MSDTDTLLSSFRGPTPPPALDEKVMQAAQGKAASLGKGQRPRLSAEPEKSYTDGPKSEQKAMSDNIVFPCPACGTKYSVSPHHAGKKTTCKKCSAQVTVPTPQVANPTIVGGTRTIRRADIDPGASAREDAVNAPATEVDMTGGASVLRKEETVIGAPPMHATSVGTRVPARGRPGAAGTAGPRQSGPVPGRPAPYGAPGAPKKNNMPMMIGIGGGALGLLLVIIIVVVASSGPDGGGNTVAGGSNTSDSPKTDPDVKLLQDHRTAMKSAEALTLDQVNAYYDQANERIDKADWRVMRDQWAPLLSRRAEAGASSEVMADIALKLDSAKYAEGRSLMSTAWPAMIKDKKAVTERTVGGKKVQVVNAKFKDMVTRLGWVGYVQPAEMDEAFRLEVDGASEYFRAYNGIEQTYRDVGLYPPETVEELKSFEKRALDGYQQLLSEDKDGWAIKSRMAWIRFKGANNNKAKVDRVKGKRSFSPLAMERENEPFDAIWSYAYGPSIMVFVEKPIGQESLDRDFLESLESKKALLRDLADWFNVKLVNKFNLQRVKPKDNAAQAQEEGWPMEVTVFKDRPTFEKYYFDSTGGDSVPPGARAYYSPLDERVVTYDDRADLSADTVWFNQSVLIHETFHMLSDFYAANPMFSREEIMTRPRYSSILVQEGLTDSVGGFTRDGEGETLKYEFLQLNHLRLSDFKAIYEILGKKELYRIRDTIECRHYGQCDQKAAQRMKDEKFKVNPLWLGQVARGMYYATSCQISYFFENYKEGGKYPYRDKWWKWIGDDYLGKNQLSGYDDNSAIKKFKDTFDISDDADWDALEKDFIDFTMDLNAEDVGKGGTDLKEDEKDGSVMPGLPPLPGAGPGGFEMPALPSREEEEALVG